MSYTTFLVLLLLFLLIINFFLCVRVHYFVPEKPLCGGSIKYVCQETISMSGAHCSCVYTSTFLAPTPKMFTVFSFQTSDDRLY